MMQGRNAAVVAMTYLGAVRAVPSYNVMGLAKASLEACIRYLAFSVGPLGIRVNGISAGPIKTLVAAGSGKTCCTSVDAIRRASPSIFASNAAPNGDLRFPNSTTANPSRPPFVKGSSGAVARFP